MLGIIRHDNGSTHQTSQCAPDTTGPTIMATHGNTWQHMATHGNTYGSKKEQSQLTFVKRI